MENSKTDGVYVSENVVNGFKVNTVQVTTEECAKALRRAIGTYITIEAGTRLDCLPVLYDIGECMAQNLHAVLLPYFNRRLCICGLGNQNKVTDSLGPEVVRRLPLRLLNSNYLKVEHQFQQVSACIPGVLGSNGVTTDVVVEGIVNATGSDCVLLIDSLVTGDFDRLLRTLQISTAGGTRTFKGDKKPDWERLGLPILTVGFPTSIPASALIPDAPKDELLSGVDVADTVSAAARIIAYAILRVCWPTLSLEECHFFTATEPIALFGGTSEECGN